MQKLYDKLAKILRLEAERDYTNTAVIGGIESFLTFWYQEVRAVAKRDDIFKIDDIVSQLRTYESLSPRERQGVVATILKKLGHKPPAGAQPVAPQPTAPEKTEPERTETVPTRADAAPQASPQKEDAESPRRRPAHQQGVRAPDIDADKLLELDAQLDASVQNVSGVGKKWAQRLRRLGIETIRDLLYHLPHRYEDFRTLRKISELMYGDTVTITGTVENTTVRESKRNGTLIVTSVISDGTGTIQATWFNQPYLTRQLRRGRPIRLSGTVDQYLGRLVFKSPEWEPVDRKQLHTGGLVPIYPLTEQISIKWLRGTIRKAVRTYARKIPDPVPAWLRQREAPGGRIDLSTALTQVHMPTGKEAIQEARQRLAFDELLLIQIGVLRQRQRWKERPGYPIAPDTEPIQRFERSLPFSLTSAQRRALDEILEDMRQPSAMSRLLQGDVGSGKTVVAAAALLQATAAGFQGAIMAPTEILAEQHYASLRRLLDPETPLLPNGRAVRIALLTGTVQKTATASGRDAVVEQIAAGDVDVVVGTHALIQDHVDFARLGLAIVDEQHRFGVRQRASLREKGHHPHMLVMSATPIPRSLALTLYGDLDISVIDELPPGRPKIKTVLATPRERERAYQYLRSQVEAGRQAFIICPLVEDSDTVEAKAAVDEYTRLRREVFPDLRLGLLHGRMSAEEKETAMAAFYRGETDILVSTAVVEVGIDVPNATVMLIESANRFGLAQLHQFRGRVGRGEHPSACILLADENLTSESEARLNVMAETDDGFELAEEDLKLRGPGEFFGTKQSGLPELRVASLSDTKTIERARRAARALLNRDPDLTGPETAVLRKYVQRFWKDAEGDLS